MAVPLIEGFPLYHPNVTGQEEGPFYNFWTVTCPGVAPGTYVVVRKLRTYLVTVYS